MQTESREEASILRVLEDNDEIAAFCEQPTRIERDDVDYYCIDYAAVTRDKIPVLMEVKPLTTMASEAVLRKALAALDFAAKFGCVYMLADRNGRGVLDLFGEYVPDEVRVPLLGMLETKASLSAADCVPYLEGAPSNVLSALAVQNGLSFFCLPGFNLRRLRDGLRWTDLVRVDPKLRHTVGNRADRRDPLLRRYW